MAKICNNGRNRLLYNRKIKRSKNLQLNDFDIFINKQNIVVNYKKESFLDFEYKQNPVSKIINLK